jgi:electron transfer flavoprotein beta subunit
LATSYTLSQGIKLLGRFDLIICGKQTTDGDTAQVGPALAEYLRIPHVSWVLNIESNENGILVEQDLPETCETVFMKYPCLITVERSGAVPRLPSYRRMTDTQERPVIVKSLDDFLDSDESKYGLAGSPTRVVKMYPPEAIEKHEIWEGTGDELSVRLKNTLGEMKFL